MVRLRRPCVGFPKPPRRFTPYKARASLSFWGEIIPPEALCSLYPPPHLSIDISDLFLTHAPLHSKESQNDPMTEAEVSTKKRRVCLSCVDTSHHSAAYFIRPCRVRWERWLALRLKAHIWTFFFEQSFQSETSENRGGESSLTMWFVHFFIPPKLSKVFSPVSVGLSAELYENYSTVFHKTWMEDGPRSPFGANRDKWMDSGTFSHFFQQCELFFYIFVNFPLSNVWILIKRLAYFR